MSAHALFVQNQAVSRSTQTRVALLMSSEPVFGALFASVWLGERASLLTPTGGGVIVLASLQASIKGKDRRDGDVVPNFEEPKWLAPDIRAPRKLGFDALKAALDAEEIRRSLEGRLANAERPFDRPCAFASERQKLADWVKSPTAALWCSSPQHADSTD
ncbi:EamA family transporter [Paraburkholderia silvatlantica]|uniref:EamA family transporter n=1 Tax=Paraburkholderia silvatlantica TaxID=321895 RepID=UPI00361964CD